MGSAQSRQKFQLTPPRIFLLRKDFFVCGNIKAGELAKRVTEDFLCPPNYTLGGTLLLSEQVSDDTVAQCDADIAVGPNGAYANGGVRVANEYLLGSAEITGRTLELALMTTPIGPASLFAKINATAGEEPTIGGGIIWRPSFKYSEEKVQGNRNVLQQTDTVASSQITGTRQKPGEWVAIRSGPNPRIDNSGFGAGSKWVEENDFVTRPINLDTAMRFYATKKYQLVTAGTHISLRTRSLFAELVTEVDTSNGEFTKSDIGISWLLEQKSKTGRKNDRSVGNLEVAVAFRNFQRLFDNVPIAGNPDPQITFSFYKHMVVPRKIFVATDTRFKLISNYIDIGFELGLNPRQFIDIQTPGSTPTHPDVDMKVGGSWQINKNNLMKIKIDPKAVSISHTFKAWWKPRWSLSSTWSYDLAKGDTTIGFWIVVDTVDKLEHEVAHATFRDSVGYNIVDYTPIEDKDFI